MGKGIEYGFVGIIYTGVGRESQTQGFQHLRASLEKESVFSLLQSSSTVVPGLAPFEWLNGVTTGIRRS